MSRFPRMAMVKQEFPRPQVENIAQTVRTEIQEKLLHNQSIQGKSIAVAAGSRGITNLALVTRTAVDTLRDLGAQPFIIPAMGSHGGGTEAGQKQILADYGITEESMGVPIKPSLETVRIDETPEGIPVHLAKTVYEADGILMINRIKPHTDFHGVVESGLLKMIAIGLGKIDGALNFHSGCFDHPHSELILSIGRVVLQSGKILGGIALLENATHETALIEAIPPEQIEEREKALLPRARELMPSLPVKKADVLIINKIGKNISGVGMDPNITGRCYRIHSRWNTEPDFIRIIALDLTEQTKGNAVGVGLADFCSERLLEKMDRKATYLNSIVSRNVICSSIPPNFSTDTEILERCLMSLREGTSAANVRLLRIENTLELSTLQASEALLDELRSHPNVKSIGELREMEFDENGYLI